MKRVVVFRPSFGGTTAKRILSTDTVDIPIQPIAPDHVLGAEDIFSFTLEGLPVDV